MVINLIKRQHLVNSLVGSSRVSNLSFLVAPMGMGKTTLMFQAIQQALHENSDLVVRELKNNYSRDDLFAFCARVERLNNEDEILIVIDDLIDLSDADLHSFQQFILKMLDRGAVILVALTPAQLYITENCSEFHCLKTSDLKLSSTDAAIWAERFKIFSPEFDRSALYTKLPYLIQSFACAPEQDTLKSESFQRSMLELLTSFFLDEGLLDLQKLAYMLMVLGEGKISEISRLYHDDTCRELLLYLHRFHSYFAFDWSEDSFSALPLSLEYIKELDMFVDFDATGLLKACLQICVRNQNFKRAYDIYMTLGDRVKPQELIGLDPLAVIQKAPADFLKAYAKDCLHEYRFPSPEDAISNLVLSLRFSDFRLKSVVLSLLEKREASTDKGLLEIAYLAVSLHEFIRTGDLTTDYAKHMKTLPNFIGIAKAVLVDYTPQSKSAFLEQLYEIEQMRSDSYLKKLYLTLASFICLVSGFYHEGIACITKEGSYEHAANFIDAILALNLTVLSYLSYVPDGMNFEIPTAFYNAKKFFIDAVYQDMIHYAHAIEMCVTKKRAQSMYRSLACKAMNVAARRSESLLYRMYSLMACEDDYALGAYQRGLTRAEQAHEYFSRFGYAHMMVQTRRKWCIGAIHICTPAQIQYLLCENLKLLDNSALSDIIGDLSLKAVQPHGIKLPVCELCDRHDVLYQILLVFESLIQLMHVGSDEQLDSFVNQYRNLVWNPAFRSILVEFYELVPGLRKHIKNYLPAVVLRGMNGIPLNNMTAYDMHAFGVQSTQNALRLNHDPYVENHSWKENLVNLSFETQNAIPDINKVRIQVLGSFELSYGVEHIHDAVLNKRRVLQLLTYLSIHHKKGVRRREIIEELWPHLGYAEGRNNLYSTLSSLKSKLKPYLGCHELFITQNNYLRLNPDLVCTDIAELELITRVLKTEKNKLSPAQIMHLSLKLDKIYKGDLMVGTFEEPTSFESARESLKQNFIDAMLAGYQAALETSDGSTALYFAQKAYDANKYREDIVIALIRAFMVNLRRSEAMEICLDYMQYQTREFGLEPTRELQLLYTQLIRGTETCEGTSEVQDLGADKDKIGEDDEDAIENIAS